MTRIAKVWVDEPACGSNRACMLQETHVFLDKGDYFPVIADDASAYFESHRRQIIEAVLNCPVSAIFLQFADGKVISSNDPDKSMGIEEWINY